MDNHGVIANTYDIVSTFDIHHNSNILSMHKHDWRNPFVAFVDNQLLEIGDEKTYENPPFELEYGTTLGFNISLGEKNKVWDPRLELECDFWLYELDLSTLR